MMVRSGDLTVRTRFEERPCSCSRSTQLRHLTKTIHIAVVRTASTMTRKEIGTDLAVLTQHRRIEVGMDIIAGMFVDHTRVGYIDEIPYRLFGNDIDHTGNRIRTVHRRTAATDDFDTVNHRRRYLLQSVHRCHRREDRSAVHKDLCVLALQTVDTQFRFTAVRARVLHPQTGLKIQHVCHARHGCRFKQLRRQHIDNRRRLLPLRLIAVSGDHHTVEQLRHLTDGSLQFHGLMFLNLHRQFQILIAHV